MRHIDERGIESKVELVGTSLLDCLYFILLVSIYTKGC